MELQLSETGRILCLDIGQKRTGIALSDETRLIATPRSVILSEPRKKWISEIKTLIEENEVTLLLVGLPLNHHGEEGQDAENIRKYIAALRAEVSTPLIEWDERFTTAQAERMLISGDVSRKNRKDVIDKVAAAIILQSYLDSLRFGKSDDTNYGAE